MWKGIPLSDVSLQLGQILIQQTAGDHILTASPVAGTRFFLKGESGHPIKGKGATLTGHRIKHEKDCPSISDISTLFTEN